MHTLLVWLSHDLFKGLFTLADILLKTSKRLRPIGVLPNEQIPASGNVGLSFCITPFILSRSQEPLVLHTQRSGCPGIFAWHKIIPDVDLRMASWMYTPTLWSIAWHVDWNVLQRNQIAIALRNVAFIGTHSQIQIIRRYTYKVSTAW